MHQDFSELPAQGLPTLSWRNISGSTQTSIESEAADVNTTGARGNPERFQCEWCEATSKSKAGVSNHARKAHPDEYAKRCSQEDQASQQQGRSFQRQERIRLLAKAEAELLGNRGCHPENLPADMSKALIEIGATRLKYPTVRQYRSLPEYKEHLRIYKSEQEGTEEPPVDLPLPSTSDHTPAKDIQELTEEESSAGKIT